MHPQREREREREAIVVGAVACASKRACVPDGRARMCIMSVNVSLNVSVIRKTKLLSK